MSRSPCRVSTCVAIISAALVLGCEDGPPQDLETPSPDAQTSKLAPTSQKQPTNTELPDEFRRFEYEAEGSDGLEVDLHAEEVISGVRLQTELDNAEPGSYLAVFHDSGTCKGHETANLGPSVDLMSSSSNLKGPDGALIYVLGPVEVDADGNGHARWLTAVGNLRESQASSLLGGVFALYRSESAEKLGKLKACISVENQKKG